MKRITLLFVFLFLFSVIAIAQQKKYVSYTVKKGETVKSIAKAYNITTRDLLQINPDISRNLKPNTVIIVPNKYYGKVGTKAEKNNKKLYFVLPKDTLYGISKMFGITIDELIAANPQIADGLKPGMELLIPESGKIASTTINETVNYEYHTVIKDDTMYNLSKKYDVSQSELLRLNPELADGLKLGMQLKIKAIHKTIIEKTANNAKSESYIAGHFKENIDFSKEINVVLMLPYQTNMLNDSTRNENFGKNHSLLNIVTDFHLGATMAIDSLRKRGLDIKVKFLDTENSIQKLQALVNRNDFKTVDVVIGPLFFDNALWLSKHIEVPVIAPFYSKSQSAVSVSNLVKAAPEENLPESELFKYLGQNYKEENIVVVNDGNSDSQSKLWRVVNRLKAIENVQNIAVVKSENGFISSSKFAEKLTKTENNWVILVSDEMVTTASAVNSLKGLADNYKITLMALDKGKNFVSIDNNLLGKLNFIFPSTDFLDVDDPNENNFYKTFQEKNYAIPSKYALKGFDITYDALVRIATTGNLEIGLEAGKSSRISTMFNYAKNSLGCFENNGVYIIQYNKALTPTILNY